jgi:hypothetical protein
MLSCTGVLVVGVTSVARERGRERERERESPCVRPSLPISSVPPPTMSTCLWKALDIPFYRYKEMAELYNGV